MKLLIVRNDPRVYCTWCLQASHTVHLSPDTTFLCCLFHRITDDLATIIIKGTSSTLFEGCSNSCRMQELLQNAASIAGCSNCCKMHQLLQDASIFEGCSKCRNEIVHECSEDIFIDTVINNHIDDMTSIH